MNQSQLAYQLQFDRNDVKVAIICATYQPRRSYQENLWAETLADMKMDVCLFHPTPLTSGKHTTTTHTHAPLHQAMHHAHIETPLGHCYQTQAIPSLYLPSHQYITQDLSPAVIEFQPHLIIVFGAIMHFCRSLCTDPALAHVPLITIFSLNRVGRHPFRWWGGGLSWRQRALGLAFHLVRMPDAFQAIRRSSLSIANTPEATDILRQFIHGDMRIQWARKHIELPLGFCPHTFFFDTKTRNKGRRQLLHHTLSTPSVEQSKPSILLLFSSRFVADKWPAILKVWRCVEQCMQQSMQQSMQNHMQASSKQQIDLNEQTHHSHVPNIHMLWIGLNENKESHQLRDLIQKSKYQQHHHAIPFVSRDMLSMYYQSADIILFPQASISCQEAMGTGAHIYTIADPALNHLQQLYDRLWMVDVEQWPHSLFQMIHHKYVLDDDIRHQSATQVRTHLAYPNLVKEAFRQLAYNLSETGEKISY